MSNIQPSQTVTDELSSSNLLELNSADRAKVNHCIFVKKQKYNDVDPALSVNTIKFILECTARKIPPFLIARAMADLSANDSLVGEELPVAFKDKTLDLFLRNLKADPGQQTLVQLDQQQKEDLAALITVKDERFGPIEAKYRAYYEAKGRTPVVFHDGNSGLSLPAVDQARLAVLFNSLTSAQQQKTFATHSLPSGGWAVKIDGVLLVSNNKATVTKGARWLAAHRGEIGKLEELGFIQNSLSSI